MAIESDGNGVCIYVVCQLPCACKWLGAECASKPGHKTTLQLIATLPVSSDFHGVGDGATTLAVDS
eukprot:2957102-Alexandrium_andersonii.AAC.1